MGLLTNQCSCQVLNKICIDDSLAKFISLVFQIYLAVLAVANSLRKLCLTAEEFMLCVTQTRQVQNQHTCK